MTEPEKKPHLYETLKEIAEKLADKARGEDMGFKDQLDTFKALSTFYFNTKKVKGLADDEDNPNTEETFDDFRESVARSGTTEGGTA